MFEKLFGKKKKVDDRHPLASAEGLAELLAGLPRDDGLTLLSVIDDWLDDARDRVDEIGVEQALNAALELDAAGHQALEKLLATYFQPGAAGHGSNALLERVANHLAKAGGAYAAAFEASEGNLTDVLRPRFVLAGERYFRAWGQHRRIGRFRQRPPGKASWEQAHRIMCQLVEWGLYQGAQAAFRGEPASKPLREYLVTVYEETVPWGNLQPIQLEMAARLINAQEGLEWMEVATTAVTHSIDIGLGEGPRRCAAEGAVSAPTLRFLTTINLHTAVENLLALVTSREVLPKWLDGMNLDPVQMTGTLQTLASHWSSAPPSRQSAREGRYLPVVGAFGFSIARQLVEVTQNVGKGLGQPVVSGPKESAFHSEFDRAFAAHRFGHAESVEQPKAKQEVKLAEPIVRLKTLEAEVGALTVESWTTVDSSETGIGVNVPALLPRHAAGVLVAWREVDDVQWKIGVIRRVGRDPQGKPSVGIQALGGTPLTAVLHLLRSTAKGNDAWDDQAEWIFAILPDTNAKNVLLPAGSFMADMPVDLITDLGQHRAWMKKLIERNGDWESVEVEIES